MKKIVFVTLVVCFALTNYAVSQNKNPTNETKFELTKDFKNSPFYKEFVSDSDKILLVNLWATWCSPCIKEMPILNKIKSQYSQLPVNFISLSLENDLEKVESFLAKDTFRFKDITIENLKYRGQIYNFLNQRPLNARINKWSVPMTYLIKNKEIVATIKGSVEKNEILDILDRAITE